MRRKKGGLVYLPVPKALEDALAALPAPRGAGPNPRCWFWNEVGSRVTVVSAAGRSLHAVFKRSGVKDAHAHKFRHTLATEYLARGYTEEDVAEILGISPAVVHAHYAKWSQSRQERTDRAARDVHAEAFGVLAPSELVQNEYADKANPVIN